MGIWGAVFRLPQRVGLDILSIALWSGFVISSAFLLDTDIIFGLEYSLVKGQDEVGVESREGFK